jgi:2-(1,2-epoxy-1,2-dihydrophenyl)acetyl-CoA isomerase
MTFNDIRLGFDGSVAVLTLHRPEKLNSFTWAMHQEVKKALAEIERQGARAMVLTGAGRGFCAGQDLADPTFSPTPDFDAGKALEENYNPLVRHLKALPFPVIAAVNGVAAGAGANIALACDIVLAAKSASFLQAFARIGLIPDAGGTWTLTRLLGEARAKGLAMLAEPLPAETAERWGLIWKAVEDGELMNEAMGLARRLADQPTRAFALIKQAVHAASANDFAGQLELEVALQREAAATADFREGVAAFLEKRKARFVGH